MTDRDGEELFNELYADALSTVRVILKDIVVMLDLQNDKFAKLVVYHYT